MKNSIFFVAFMLIFSAFANSQMLENFEHTRLNLMLGGTNDNSSMVVVPNPDPGEANPNHYVVKFHRSQHGMPWGGFWSALPETFNMSASKYIHVKVWKPRISPLRFKVEGGPGGTFELESVQPQTLTEEWEIITFHFPDADGDYPIMGFSPDFMDPVDLSEDIVIYFDHIVLSDNAVFGEGNEVVLENFEVLHMNPMLGGDGDDSHFTIVPNPAPDNVNSTNHVARFHRSQHGVPWGGFWAPLAESVDMTENKYVMVDVWKPRISPIRFKVEGGPGGTFELESIEPQTKVGEWETIVFHFPDASGLYPIVAFMPDFSDPVDLNEDITIFFDNIRVVATPDDDNGNGNGDDFADFDFMWCDFEDQFSNVGGFRETINGNTTATDVPGLGAGGGTAIELSYELTSEVQVTGYQMWAFPDFIDVTAFNFFAIRAKAASNIENAGIVLRDNVELNGRSYHNINLTTEWRDIFISLDDFVTQDGFDNAADLTLMHLIQVLFEDGKVSAAEGVVHIDVVGFTMEAGTSVDEWEVVAETINVYPNPARRMVNVSAQSGALISLFDISGRMISQQIASNQVTVMNLEGLSEGMYIIRVTNNGQISTRKLMVY